eukprot:943108-Prorocentrum_minimum.AAC.4
MGAEDAKLKKLLAENRDFVKLLENGKVQCLLSKHEMSNKYDAVSQYLRCVPCAGNETGFMKPSQLHVR